MRTNTIFFINHGKQIGQLACEVAETLTEKRIGLMYRQQLGYHEGMMFLFRVPFLQCFTMKNVQFPLDIVFIWKNKIIKIVQTIDEEQRWFPKIYSGIATAVLECHQGFCRDHSITAGTTIKISEGEKENSV